jgi:hypothetical protein
MPFGAGEKLPIETIARCATIRSFAIRIYILPVLREMRLFAIVSNWQH